MDNIYMLSDSDIIQRISARLKELRLKQNISRQDLSESSGVSLSSIVRMEEGEIKSFESLLRVMRILGKIDIFQSLVEEEEISPIEYFKLVNSVKKNPRRRASKSIPVNCNEESVW